LRYPVQIGRDEDYGSNFAQEVKPGRYPVIAEAIGIEHR
jgi:hypothetical protein